MVEVSCLTPGCGQKAQVEKKNQVPRTWSIYDLRVENGRTWQTRGCICPECHKRLVEGL